jgi:hypothetical protein
MRGASRPPSTPAIANVRRKLRPSRAGVAAWPGDGVPETQQGWPEAAPQRRKEAKIHHLAPQSPRRRLLCGPTRRLSSFPRRSRVWPLADTSRDGPRSNLPLIVSWPRMRPSSRRRSVRHVTPMPLDPPDAARTMAHGFQPTQNRANRSAGDSWLSSHPDPDRSVRFAVTRRGAPSAMKRGTDRPRRPTALAPECNRRGTAHPQLGAFRPFRTVAKDGRESPLPVLSNARNSSPARPTLCTNYPPARYKCHSAEQSFKGSLRL